jgi:hypothetical protein
MTIGPVPAISRDGTSGRHSLEACLPGRSVPRRVGA